MDAYLGGVGDYCMIVLVVHCTTLLGLIYIGIYKIKKIAYNLKVD